MCCRKTLSECNCYQVMEMNTIIAQQWKSKKCSNKIRNVWEIMVNCFGLKGGGEYASVSLKVKYFGPINSVWKLPSYRESNYFQVKPCQAHCSSHAVTHRSVQARWPTRFFFWGGAAKQSALPCYVGTAEPCHLLTKYWDYHSPPHQ